MERDTLLDLMARGGGLGGVAIAGYLLWAFELSLAVQVVLALVALEGAVALVLGLTYLRWIARLFGAQGDAEPADPEHRRSPP